MHQSTHFSALSSAILLLAKGIDSYGHDSAELFSKAGLDHSRLKDPLARENSYLQLEGMDEDPMPP